MRKTACDLGPRMSARRLQSQYLDRVNPPFLTQRYLASSVIIYAIHQSSVAYKMGTPTPLRRLRFRAWVIG